MRREGMKKCLPSIIGPDKKEEKCMRNTECFWIEKGNIT